MPESCRDRPTVDFEDVLLFSQGPRYFWDQEAGREEIREPRNWPTREERKANGEPMRRADPRTSGAKNTGRGLSVGNPSAGRNMRACWTINPEPTDEEHFAAWPVALAARLIRVMTSERGVCPECGAPWAREVERTPGIPNPSEARRQRLRSAQGGGVKAVTLGRAADGEHHGSVATTTGWSASCGHDADPVPATVLDPFAGLGRTWEAARETGRRFVGTDLGFGYCKLALSRNELGAMARRRIAKPTMEDWGALFRDPATW